MAGGASYSRYLVGSDENGSLAEMKIESHGKVPTITECNYGTHAGKRVVATHYDSDVDTTAPLEFYIKSTEYDLHGNFSIHCDQAAQYLMYTLPSTDVSDKGTALLACRMRRGTTVGDTERMAVWHTPTIATTTGGVNLVQMHNTGSTGKANQPAIGGGIEPSDHYMFSKASSTWRYHRLEIHIRPDRREAGGDCEQLHGTGSNED